ncbi:MAG: hypothetical protein IJ087_23100 [Eggerthellaceae bacterium]|nr:hypothetical protein [Eggerthellaceae bacterium]MBQ9004735.1 hypothetical protein [Eggerthellaceae bacterium]
MAACSHNLLAMKQREVPFSRTKGMDPDIYDMPFDEAEGYLDEAARSVLGTYEDRIDIDAVELDFGESDDVSGASFTVEIVQSSINEESDDYWEGDD